MHIPEGYSETQVIESMDGAVGALASSFKFGYYDIEDMKQEGYRIALEALDKYRSDKGCSLKTFLINHIRRRFINLHRDKVERGTPPCSTCPHVKTDGCSKYDDKMDCQKFVNWKSRNVAKRSLAEGYDVNKVVKVVPIDEQSDMSYIMSRSELFKLVQRELPASSRADFRRLVEGAKLAKPRKDKLLETIREIVNASEEDTW